MRNYVIINGVNSLTIKGLAINELPPIVKAPMRVLQEEIDGRDGDIITDLGYGAYDKVMTIGLYDGYDINEIIAFFNKEGTIVFSDEADKYYNFKIIEQIDYERLIKFRTASITFHCQPFKYPLTETPVEITNEYVEAEGTNLTLTPTAEAPISIDLKGNTSQGLPSEYQAVEYIESSGTQYIDTGLKGKNAISIDTDYSITSATTWSSLLGCANGTAGNSVACVIGITKNGSINGGWYWRNTTNEQFDSNNVAQLDLKTNLKVSATSFVFKNTNGTKTYSFSEVNSFETTPNMYIFASNKNGTINDYSKIKLYYMKIFDGTTLKREYLPCYRISDNVIGLYDMVENKFYTNAGTGTFTKGSNTTLPTPDYPQEIHNVSGDNTIEICGLQMFQDTYIGIPSADNINAYLKAGTYTLASCDSNNFGKNIYVRLFNKNTKNIVTTSGHATATTGGSYVSWNFSSSSYSYYGGSGVSTLTLTLDDDYYLNIGLLDSDSTRQVMLVKGSETIRTYEAYTGQTQLISLGVENLFDKDNANILDGYFRDSALNQLVISSGNANKTIIFKGLPNTTYTITKGQSQRFRIGLYNSLISSNGTYTFDSNAIRLDSNDVSLVSNYTITTTSTNYWIYVMIYGDSETQTVQNLLDTIQIEKGSKKNSYTPYGTTPIELCKIGTYQDYIYKEDDKWYLHKEIGKVVLDGSESGWNYDSQRQRFHKTITDMIVSTTETSPIFSNYYRYITFSDTSPNGGATSYYGRVYLYNYDYTTTSDLQTWLQSHNTIVYYVLATPTNTEITDLTLISQLEAIKNMTSYNGTTNISQENNDEPFIIKAKAMKQGSGTATITNSGNIYSKPTIDIEGTGIVDVYIGANQIFSVNVDEEVIIDSTNLEAYKPDGTLANRNVTGNIANLKLPTGNSTIKVDGDIDKATITNYTRWL